MLAWLRCSREMKQNHSVLPVEASKPSCFPSSRCGLETRWKVGPKTYCTSRHLTAKAIQKSNSLS